MTSTQAEFADDEYVLVYNEETKSYQATRMISSTKVHGFEKLCNGADGSSNKQLPSVKENGKREYDLRRFDDHRSRRMLNSGGVYNYNWRWTTTRGINPYPGIPSELTILDNVRPDVYRESSLD